MSASLGGLAFTPMAMAARPGGEIKAKSAATVWAAVVGLSEDGQATHAAMLRDCAGKTGVKLHLETSPVNSEASAAELAKRIAATRPDGVALVVTDEAGLGFADAITKAIESVNSPMVPVMLHLAGGGADGAFQRPGLFVADAARTADDLRFGFRMIHTRGQLRQTVLLGFDNKPAGEAELPFFGIKLRIIPFDRYAREFEAMPFHSEARAWIGEFSTNALERRGITDEALENAAKAHFALKKILAEENADGLSMNCLRTGFLKPCMSFASFNGDLIPAACEMDIPALCTLLVGRHLIGRPGFMHNSSYETEKNHYYASHCTCTPRIRGTDKPALPFMLRRFMHTNEGSCAIQTFWEKDDPVTMVRAYPGKPPQMDVYAGKVVLSHPMPPAGGCTTNVEVKLTDRADAMMVQGHHNVLFYGDHARQFRTFARFFRLGMVDSGYQGPWPG
jgi:hypothetical protein